MYSEWISIAKERLAEFKFLQKIFNDFEGYEDNLRKTGETSSNVIFNMLRAQEFDNKYASINMRESVSSHEELRNLENALNHFFSNTSNNQKNYKKFISDIISTNLYPSLGAFYEIKIAFEIYSKSLSKKVQVYHKTSLDSNPDIYVTIGEKNVCIELTGLNPRMSEVKIDEIIKKSSYYFLNKANRRNFFVIILLDTIVFKKDEDGHLDVTRSVDFLNSFIEKMKLYELIGSNLRINFKARYIELEIINKLLNKKLRVEIKDDENHNFNDTLLSKLETSSLNELDELDKTGTSEDIIEWLKQVTYYNFVNCPFDEVIISPNVNNGCIMMNSIDWMTSDKSRHILNNISP